MLEYVRAGFQPALAQQTPGMSFRRADGSDNIAQSAFAESGRV